MTRLSFLAILSVIGGTSAYGEAVVQPANADSSLGGPLYAENCASCHGVNLEGQPDWRSPDENGILPAPPHDESGHTWHHADALLFEYTKLGGQAALQSMGVEGFASGMPAFGDTLTDDEIWNILVYIKSTWPERARVTQAARNEAVQ